MAFCNASDVLIDMWKIEITTTSLRPDIVLWSTSANGMIIAIPWKKNNGSLWERKKYREATVTCAEAGWKAQIYPVEVRWMDFVRESTPQLPKPLRVPGSEQKKTLKDHSRKGASGCDPEEMIWSGEIKDLRTSHKQQWTIDYCDCELQWHPGMTGGQSGKPTSSRKGLDAGRLVKDLDSSIAKPCFCNRCSIST